MRISIVVSGLSESTERLQPWRYISELATGLVGRGHEVELISEAGASNPPIRGGPTRLGLRSLGSHGGLIEHLQNARPDIVMWNAGATSALHPQPLGLVEAGHVAIFTSPLYRPADLLGVGVDLGRRPVTYAALGLGSLMPRRAVASYLGTHFAHVIALGPTTALQLVAGGLAPDSISILPPGKDTDMAFAPAAPRLSEDATTFMYAGSPLPIRGPDVLIRAFAKAHPAIENARLLILSRHERVGLARDTERLRRLAVSLGVDRLVDIVSGTLPRTEFLEQVAKADVFVLPFRLVPSEAPLGVLEAAGASRPLIASDLPAVADLAAPGSLLVRPGNVGRLAEALTLLAADPARAYKLAIDAAQWYARWPTWPEVVERLDATLTSLIVKPRAGASRTRLLTIRGQRSPKA